MDATLRSPQYRTSLEAVTAAKNSLQYQQGIKMSIFHFSTGNYQVLEWRENDMNYSSWFGFVSMADGFIRSGY